MKVGSITARELSVFRSLLLPEAVSLLEQGAPVTALGLQEEDLAVGALMGTLEDERLHIRSLYVAPEYRRRGGGTMLLETLLSLLPGFAYDVSAAFTVTLPEHESLAPFFASQGFHSEAAQNEIYAATLHELCAAPFFAGKTAPGGKSFRELSGLDLSLLEMSARKAGAPIPKGGLQEAAVDADVSTVLLRKGVPHGYAVVCRRGRFLSMEGIWTDADPAAIAALLRGAMLRLKGKYPQDTLVLIQPVIPAALTLLRALCPNCRRISHVMRRPLSLPKK